MRPGRSVGNALRENRCRPASDWRNQKRGGVIAAEFEVAAELFGIGVDAAFFDFELADVALAEQGGERADAERQDFVDFEAGQRIVRGDCAGAGEVCRAGGEGPEIVFGGECAGEAGGGDGGVDVEEEAVRRGG